MLNPFQSLNHERLEQVLAGLFPQKVELREKGKMVLFASVGTMGRHSWGSEESCVRGMKKSV
ncbi:MAG TPA: hypothetical protein DCZ74_05975 [Treponema sp.]|nr:hypothetical protein [Treponema sp.]